MDALPGPVTKSTRLMPTRVNSSTTYCTTGLRPTGSISLGCDLVAGSRRVPRPATGTTARLTGIEEAASRPMILEVLSRNLRLGQGLSPAPPESVQDSPYPRHTWAYRASS